MLSRIVVGVAVGVECVGGEAEGVDEVQAERSKAPRNIRKAERMHP